MAKPVRPSGIDKRATCHTLRHSFATHLLIDPVELQAFAKLYQRRLSQFVPAEVPLR